MIISERTENKFWENILPDPSSGCWIWLGAIDSSGYGSLHQKTKASTWITIRSHVVSFILHRGYKPKKPRMVLHTCDIRICCHPDHLYDGTSQQNTNDRKLRNSRNGENNPAVKITNEIALEIKILLSKHYKVKYIANKLQISKHIIYNIKYNNTWSHIIVSENS